MPRFNRRVVLAFTVFAAATLYGAPRWAEAQTPMGSAFTYQGRLTHGGAPASGVYDLRFTLFPAATGSMPVGPALIREDVAVDRGLFTVKLDFGPAFAGSGLWLEIATRPGAGGVFTTLAPRKELRPAPDVGLHVQGNAFFDVSEGRRQAERDDRERRAAADRLQRSPRSVDVVAADPEERQDQARVDVSAGWPIRRQRQLWFIAGHDVFAWESCPTSGGWIEAPYNTVGSGNAGGWYDPATGRFTAPVSGLYMFMSSHYVYGSASGDLAYMHHQIGVNGAAVGGGGRPFADYNVLGLGPDEGPYNNSSNVTRLLFLNAGDYASVFVYCSGNGLYRYGNYSYFSGVLMR
jgi:hypothetical protein